MAYTKYTTIYLDGIDKTGKDLISAYVVKISKGRYIVNSRGIISVIAYSELYNRNFQYATEEQINTVNVFLTVEKEDWEIRCKLVNEPTIDYEKNAAAFEKAYESMKGKTVLMKFNTTRQTPYEIAKAVVDYTDALNDNWPRVLNYHTDGLTEEECLAETGKTLFDYATENMPENTEF